MRKKIISLAFIILIIVIVGTIGFTAWQYFSTVSDIYDLREDTTRQRENMLDLTIKEYSIDELESKVETVKTQLSYNTKDGVYFSRLLGKIEKNGLKLIKFQAGDTETSESIVANSMEIEIEGNHKNVIDTFKYIENSEELVQIQNIEIVRLDKSSDTDNTPNENTEKFTGEVSAKFTLVIYSITE